ncbi:MAG: hypothetical protein ACTHMD_06300 [Flavisolibacter sp.]
MRFDNLSDLPAWDDDEFDDGENEGEAWKPNPTKDACKAMYLQWQQVMMMLKGALETMQVKEDPGEAEMPLDFWDDYKQTIIGDAYEIAVKIKSSEAGLYIIRMENASIIRKNAQYIYSSLLTLMIENVIEESYVRAIRSEIDEFRELFKQWVASFQKDEYTDEWGLFI